VEIKSDCRLKHSNRQPNSQRGPCGNSSSSSIWLVVTVVAAHAPSFSKLCDLLGFWLLHAAQLSRRQNTCMMLHQPMTMYCIPALSSRRREALMHVTDGLSAPQPTAFRQQHTGSCSETGDSFS